MPIERAVAADIDSIFDLLAAQFDEHNIQTPDAALRQAIAEVLQNKGLGLFLVARHGDEVIGLAALSFAWTLEYAGKTAWLDELYVLPAWRGQGVGRALLRQAIAEAQASGCRAIDLEVDEAHRRAERLYQREGFRRLARTRWARALG
ncbi:MAG: GNAT family N-acetyltransferase [Anaerolineae bacterium]